MNSPTIVAIALGSNLGDRHAHFDYAIARLSTLLASLRQSSRFETPPVDVPGDQPTFLNAAVVGATTLGPEELLGALQAIEADRGRVRPYPLAPRTLDLDLVLFGDRIVSDSELQVPHPRFRERCFVLEPLAQVAPTLVDPVTGRSVAELFARRLAFEREGAGDGR